MSPDEAAQTYINHKKVRGEYTASTLQEHKYSLRRFREWCEEENITNMNQVTGRSIATFADWRGESVAPATVKTDLDRIRVFIRYCENIEAAPQGVADKINSPNLSNDEEARDVRVTAPEAEAILEYLENAEYGRFKHVLFYVLWHTSMRMSEARALDVDDLKYDRGQPYLDVRHRPERGTPLKNKARGEREVALNPTAEELIQAWLEFHRPNTTDEYGREPLFATSQGRAWKTTIQRNIYQITRPCIYSGDCPHGRDQENCEAMGYNTASKCPSSKSPHTIRRGSIQKALNNQAKKENVSDRANVSVQVLDKHYDTQEKKERRRRRLSDIDKF
ncbi:tyrosine-type recombinase/integrase [Natrialbaceae archaeon A-chndr2]